jgi:hypothetical protein
VLIDSVVNLLLGLVLLFFPPILVRLLGVPPAETAFYPSILGAVLVGIGIALLLDLPEEGRQRDGLGLRGAVVINGCGGLALMGWLVWGELGLPLRGEVFLWGLGVLVVGLGLVELGARGLRTRRGSGGDGKGRRECAP